LVGFFIVLRIPPVMPGVPKGFSYGKENSF
jgi:hypothetical protein